MNALATLNRFVSKTFALWVLIFAALAYFYPATFKPIAPWITILLGIIMFGMGLSLSLNDFRLVFLRPMDVLIGVLGQFVIMPLIAYGLCKALSLPPEIAIGVILVGCCPGGTASNVMTFLARGDVALSVTITSCTTLLAPIVTPALIYLFAHQWINVDPMAMFLSICYIVLIPIALGVAVHALFGKRIQIVQTTLPLISVLAILMIVSAVVAVSQKSIATAGPLIFAVVVLHNGLGLVLGYFLGKVTGMNLARRKCLSIEVGMQNSGLGVALAATHFATMPLAALPAAIFSFWHNVSGSLLASYFSRMDEPDEKKD